MRMNNALFRMYCRHADTLLRVWHCFQVLGVRNWTWWGEEGCWRSGVLEDINFYLVNARRNGEGGGGTKRERALEYVFSHNERVRSGNFSEKFNVTILLEISWMWRAECCVVGESLCWFLNVMFFRQSLFWWLGRKKLHLKNLCMLQHCMQL